VGLFSHGMNGAAGATCCHAPAWEQGQTRQRPERAASATAPLIHGAGALATHSHAGAWERGGHRDRGSVAAGTIIKAGE
jgi:hypothetical protein